MGQAPVLFRPKKMNVSFSSTYYHVMVNVALDGNDENE
jgi:hypothetical protein